MKALISALALLSFVAASTIPVYPASAQEQTTPAPAKKAATKKAPVKKKTAKKKTTKKKAAAKKKAPAKTAS
jgi:hypothetical protein